MDIRNLRSRTRVYEGGELVSEPLEWRKGRVVKAFRTPGGEWSLEAGEGNLLVGYIHPIDEGSDMGFAELPVEFFNHQLRNYDPSSEESVCEFVESWGLPFLPLRNMLKDVSAWGYQDQPRIKRALEQTDTIRKFAHVLGSKYFDDDERHYSSEFSEEGCWEYGEYFWPMYEYPVYGSVIPAEDEEEYYRSLYSLDNRGIDDAISYEEAALTIEMLQQAVECIMDDIRNGATIHARHLDVVNMGASYPRLLRRKRFHSGAVTDQQRHSMLTAAICNQIIEAFDDPAPWRDCACEGCSVTFKRKQSKAFAPASDSIYCCTACEERQRKRNQRMSAKNRIQHQP